MRFLVLGFCLALIACQPKNQQQAEPIPSVYVALDAPGWQQREGNLWLNHKVFSGWQYQRWPNGDTTFVGAFSQGKAEGFHRHWYANRQLKETRSFQHSWQEGEQRGWYESGKRAFIYHFLNDVYEGNLKEWYANGQLSQDKNYHEGRENGLQRMWYADGSLKANYVARNGRNYGFTGVTHCVNVWDSITVSH